MQPENDLNKTLRVDPRSTGELIELALSEKDEDARWEFIRILHHRPTREAFDAVRKLCESEIPFQQMVGTDILGQLGTPEKPFKAETLPILFKLVDEVKEEEALQSVVYALGRMEDEQAIEKIVELQDHPSAEVRFAVVHGLLTLEDDQAISVLIRLSDDEDEDVRNWATFGLGSQISTDTNEIRNALVKRLDEEDSEIRGEALVGLAVRKDARVIEPLLKELSLPEIGTLAIEAAGEVGDERLCEPLNKLKSWWDIDEKLLEEAINVCCRSKSNETYDS